MGQRFEQIPENLIDFIHAQKLFFVGSATAESRINISPKGMDSLRIINNKRVIWLNLTGSGNETAAHMLEDSRMTIMFAAFEGKPKILRLYGHARVIHKKDSEWKDLYSKFNPMQGARQIFDLNIDLVQSSCGMSVPFFDYVSERELLTEWANKKTDDEIEAYWLKKNQMSLDGKPTLIKEKNII